MAHAYNRDGNRNRGKQRSISAPFNIQLPSSLRDPTDSSFSAKQLTSLTNDDNAREFALGHLHNDEGFKQVWESTTIHPNTRRVMRKVVQIQTINAACNGFYRLPDGAKVMLDKNRMADAARNTRQYSNDFEYAAAPHQPMDEQPPPQIFVINGDCLDTVQCFKSRYPQSNPVVLNMASKRNPGGGWKTGAGAQEENLHRRSNMFQCLEDPYHELDGIREWDYHVPEFGGVYSPNVSVFRGSEADGYSFFPNGPQYISFIACSAYSHPPTETDRDGELKLSGKNMIEYTRMKMDAIFNIARENKHDILVLSAFGCGAYQNPPQHIAQLFEEVIRRQDCQSFKVIAFAIINDHNARKAHNPDGNIQPFAEVFKVNALTIEELQEKLSSTTEQ